jgi:hypothetical protein
LATCNDNFRKFLVLLSKYKEIPHPLHNSLLLICNLLSNGKKTLVLEKHHLKNSTEYFSFAMANTKYYSVIKSGMRWAGHVARTGKRRGAHRVLVGRPEGKRPIRSRSEHIKMDLPGVGWVGMGWIDLSRDRDRWRGMTR